MIMNVHLYVLKGAAILTIQYSSSCERKILRPAYKRSFSIFLLYGVCFLLQSFQKVQIGPQKIFLKKSKRIPKNSEFFADLRSAGKIAKTCMQKSYDQNGQLKVRFLGF